MTFSKPRVSIPDFADSPWADGRVTAGGLRSSVSTAKILAKRKQLERLAQHIDLDCFLLVQQRSRSHLVDAELLRMFVPASVTRVEKEMHPT
jgi:altronate dehydratase